VEGQAEVEPAKRPSTLGVGIAPGHFDLAGLGLLRGRDFDESDGTAGKEVVIVSKRFAERYWPNQDPLGKRLRLMRNDTTTEPWLTVVGVCPDFQQAGPTQEEETLVYVPFRQEAPGNFAILLRTTGGATAAVPGLRSEVQQMDQDLALFGVEALRESLQRQRWHLRVFGTAFSIFAMVALLMAAVGIYAVMAHATGRRTREIGVRMAMGASVREILRVVMARGVAQLGVGLALGLAAAIGVCRMMETLLFGISSTDVVTLGVVSGVLTASGLLACWIPARRAAALDPVKALRHE
jgi:predicted permease